MKVAVNGRFHAHRPTGMQRYAIAVSQRLAGTTETLRPPVALRGPAGHLWEQAVLPISSRGRLLWSPNNTGPIAHKRHVTTIHDLIPLEHPEWFNPRFSGWYGWLMPRLARHLDHVIAVSEFTRERIQALLGFPASRITVVPNGVDPAYRPQSPAEVARVRRSLGLGEAPYLLYVGSLEPRKNLRGLMQAWRMALPELDSALTLVVTGAKGRSAVFSDAQLGEIPARVHFTDYVPEPDLPALYSGSMAVVYPSLYEGFGLPVLEAMAAGAPVITSSTTSLPEVGAGAACLVNPSDTEAIAAAIHQVASGEQLRAQMSRDGLRLAARYGWDRCAAETWKVLEAYA